jgi:hypothetical protein
MIACSKHEDKESDFFCSSHDLFLCHLCAWNEHIDHPKEAKTFDQKELKTFFDAAKPSLIETRDKIDKCFKVIAQFD